MDRIVYGIAAATGLMGSVGLFPSAMLSMGPLFRAFSWWLLPVYVVLDLCSVYMHVANMRHRGGPSGIGAVSWLYYALFSLVGVQAAWWWRLASLGGLTLFHWCCHLLVPRAVATRLGWGPEGRALSNRGE